MLVWRPRFGLVAGALVACVLGVVVALNPQWAAALAAVLAVGLLAIVSPEILIVSTIMVLWLVQGQAQPGGVLQSLGVLRWTGMVLVPAATVALAASALLRRAPARPLPKSFTVSACGFFALVAVLAIAKGNDWAAVAQSVLAYGRYPALFAVLYTWGVRRKDVVAVVGTSVVVTVVAITESLTRYLVWGVRWDSISFLLGPFGTFNLGVGLVLSTAFMTASTSVRGWRWWYGVLAAGIAAVTLAGEIKAALVAIPLTVIVVLWYLGRIQQLRVRGWLLALTVVLAVASAGFAWGGFWGSSDDLARVVASSRRLAAGTIPTASDVNRLGWMASTAEYMANSNSLLFGFGPGSGLQGGLSGNQDEMLSAVGGIGRTQLSVLAWEGGLAGLAMYWFMLVVVFVAMCRTVPTREDPWGTTLAASVVAFGAYYVFIGPLYDLVWRYDVPSVVFWVGAAYLLRVGRGTLDQGAPVSGLAQYEDSRTL